MCVILNPDIDLETQRLLSPLCVLEETGSEGYSRTQDHTASSSWWSQNWNPSLLAPKHRLLTSALCGASLAPAASSVLLLALLIAP